MIIILDGLTILNKEELFKELKKQINNDEFIGNNLDALFDVLTMLDCSVEVTISNEESLKENLGSYYSGLISVFEELNVIIKK